MKKRYYWLAFLVFIVILLIFLLYLGTPLGVDCGSWNFFSGYEKSCDCIGIKTGHCPPGAVCDGGSTGCLGICSNCVCKQRNSDGNGMSIVPCD